MLLDLRLPCVPGLDVLEWLRQQPSLSQVRVLILSSSNQDSDVETAYRLGADGYLVKPPLLSELERMVRLIKQYWLDKDGPPRSCAEWEALVVPGHALASGTKGRT